MVPSGRFIVFEGGEASGKSTQAVRLASRLDALLTREPGGTALGEQLRRIALGVDAGPIEARTELLLMAASRAEHVAKVIGPALESGRDVVCDRFSASTIAYQGYGRGLPLEDVLVACELATNGLAPDLNVLLDLDAELAAERHAGPADRIESAGEDFHASVRAGFLALAAADPAHWVVIDAAKARDEVEADVLAALENRLGLPWMPPA